MSLPARTWWLSLAAAGALLLAASLVAVAVTPVPLTPNLYLVGLLAFPVVGGLVVAHQPSNRVAHLLVLVGAWDAIAAAGTTYVTLSLEVARVPWLHLPAWLATWAFWPAALLMLLLLATFPSGRVASGWLRPVLWVGGLVGAVLTVSTTMLPVPVNSVLLGDDVTNPWAVASFAPVVAVDEALPFLITVLYAVAVADLLVRWRRAAGVERLQMRWAGLGLVIVAALGVTGLATDVVGLTNELVWVTTWLGFGALPAAVGVAVTRYRLYEIDRLLSRTVTYLLVVGVLTTAYAGAVVVLGRLLPPQNDLAVAASTLTVAALFQPLRRRVQQRVDRRFNRSRYDAEQELQRFAGTLRDELDLDQLTAGLVAVVGSTVQPSTADLWVRPGRDASPGGDRAPPS